MTVPHRSTGLDAMRRRAATVPLLTAEEETALARKAKLGDAAAEERLVTAHIRFVFAIADQFTRYGVSFDELVSEGVLGLMEAVRRFDPENGARLASYAAWWIRALLRRYTLQNRRVVRAPSTRKARKVIAHLSATRRELAQRTGTEPDAAAIASELGVSEADVEEVELALQRVDVACGQHERGSYEAVCPLPSPEAVAAEREREQRTRIAVHRGLDLLTPRERLIVSQRALHESPRRLEDIGADLGVSRERVRQLQQQGFDKMRRQLRLALA